MRQVVIYPGEDGQWVAECPSLPGCISQGRTKEEAVANIREAVALFIETLEEDKLPVPPKNSRPTSWRYERVAADFGARSRGRADQGRL